MKKILALSVVIAFLCSCNIFKALHLMNQGTVSTTDFLEKVPIEFVNHMLIIPVSIGGTQYKFILDTGAPTVLSKEIADKQNLKTTCEIKSADAYKNKSSMNFTNAGDINIGNLKFINQGAAIYDFSTNKEISCFPFNSIVGANLMKSAIWQINLKDQIINITNDISKLKIADNAIKFKFHVMPSGTPVADVSVDGIQVNNVTLDYGSGSGIDLVSEKLINKIHTDKSKFTRIFGIVGMGLYGGKSDTTYIFNNEASVEENKLGSQKISVRRTGLSTIGTQIWKNYIVTFDWKTKTAYMEKIASEVPDNISTFGFTAALTDGKFMVTSITEKSSAVENGIAIGDQIISVNDKDYSSVTHDDYCNYITNGMVAKDIKTVEISFKHNDIVKKVKLERRDPLN